MSGNTTADKIKDCITKIVELQAVKRHFDSVNEDLDEIYTKKDKIETLMVKELEDINKLEKLGVKSIFHKVLGNKEEQLEKERQEYLQVTLQHREILNALEVSEFEKEILEKKMVNLDQLLNELEALKKIRSQEILAKPSALRNELVLLFNKMDENKQFDAELNEAVVAGNKAMQSLGIVYENLRKAREWGSYDMTSKNRRYKMMKHSSIDRAMQEVSRTKLMLRNFNKELQDVGYHTQKLSLHIDSITKFPGLIFDNLITDWIVQNKIKGVLSTVANLMNDVKLMIQSMESEKRKTLEDFQELDRQRHKLLEEK